MAHGVTCTVTIVYTPPSPHTYLSVLFDVGGLCLLLFSASVQDADKWEVGRPIWIHPASINRKKAIFGCWQQQCI